ncbi:MAG: hypothetical protein ACRCUJ_07710 [Phocaeicola sp.]
MGYIVPEGYRIECITIQSYRMDNERVSSATNVSDGMGLDLTSEHMG